MLERIFSWKDYGWQQTHILAQPLDLPIAKLEHYNPTIYSAETLSIAFSRYIEIKVKELV